MKLHDQDVAVGWLREAARVVYEPSSSRGTTHAVGIWANYDHPTASDRDTLDIEKGNSFHCDIICL